MFPLVDVSLNYVSAVCIPFRPPLTPPFVRPENLSGHALIFFLPPSACIHLHRGLVRLTIILSDLDDFSEMNSAYSDFLASRGVVSCPPARTTFQAGGKMPKNAK